MNLSFVKHKKSLAIIALATTMTFASCNKDKDAPALPSVTSMDAGTSDFGGSAKTEGVAYGLVTLGIAYWNTAIAINLAVPVASFKEAFNHTAVYDSKAKEWIWSYDVKVGFLTYTANLHASEDGDNIKWKMLLSQKSGFQNFEWYTGTSKKDGTSGQWKLNKDVTSPTGYIQIDWTKASDGTHSTKFLLTDPNDVNYTSYIDYSVTNETEFNGHYNIFEVGKGLTQVMWNKTDKHGKVINNASTSYCWDNATNDVTCQ